MKKNVKEKKNYSNSDITLPNSGKRIVMPIFWTIVVISGLWALMHFSTPETKLEPYTKVQKASATFDNNTETTIKTELERFTETQQPEFSNILTSNSEPKQNNYQLPRNTLEHIQKGMKLIEEGKFNTADIEFKKAAQISPNSAEVFCTLGNCTSSAGKI